MILNKNLKTIVECIPPTIAYTFRNIPFEIRLGKGYLMHKTNFYDFNSLNLIERKFLIYKKVKDRLIDAYSNIKFYKSYLDNLNFDVSQLRSFDDLGTIPILNKKILKDQELLNRSYNKKTIGIYNTGGTSGNPLHFYLDNEYYAREWAYMHLMWEKVGYNYSDCKLTIRGKNIGNRLYKYNLNQNEFLINAYHNYTLEDLIKIETLIKRYNIRFLHGYPSSIFSFLKTADNYLPLIRILKKYIKGILFSSEYPLKFQRDYIENTLTTNTISWYGHTEGAVLAGELSTKYEYVPFQTYGFTEAIKIENDYHLVSTNYYNHCSPFIRYDTEDLIEPTIENDLLIKFTIKEGRTGDYIIDKNNVIISLTNFFFGRHHKIYNHIDFCQVQQTTPGKIIIYIVGRDKFKDPYKYFDLSNFNFDVEVVYIEKPFITVAGKVPLVIK